MFKETFRKIGNKVVSVVRSKRGNLREAMEYTNKKDTMLGINNTISKPEVKKTLPEPKVETTLPTLPNKPAYTPSTVSTYTPKPSTSTIPESVDKLVERVNKEHMQSCVQAEERKQKNMAVYERIKTMPKDFTWDFGDSADEVETKIKRYEADAKAKADAEAKRNLVAKNLIDMQIWQTGKRTITDPAYHLAKERYTVLFDTNGKYSRVFVKRDKLEWMSGRPVWQLLETLDTKSDLTEYDFKKILATKPEWDLLARVFKQVNVPQRVDIAPDREVPVW